MKVNLDAIEAAKNVYFKLYATIAENVGAYSSEIAAAREIASSVRENLEDKKRKLNAIIEERNTRRVAMENDLVSVSSEEKLFDKNEGESEKLAADIDGIDEFCKELSANISVIEEICGFVDKRIERADELTSEISRLLNALGETFGARAALVDACENCVGEYLNARRFGL